MAGMKAILLIFAAIICQPVLAADKKPKFVPNGPKAKAVIEVAIRKAAGKSEGALTKADLEKVTVLELKSKKLTDADVKGLEKLTQLKVLYLCNNQLTDVKGLEKLTQLTLLSLSENQLTDLTGLEKLTQLKTLHLSYNKLTEVKGLEKLNQLTVLHLEGNPDLTKAQIDQLKKALPKCKIFSNPKK